MPFYDVTFTATIRIDESDLEQHDYNADDDIYDFAHDVSRSMLDDGGAYVVDLNVADVKERD